MMPIFFPQLHGFFLEYSEILTHKIMTKISKEIPIRIVKMTKNLNQKALAMELEIPRSTISEILSKFQGIGSVSD